MASILEFKAVMIFGVDQSYDEIVQTILELDSSYRVWEFGEPLNFGPDFTSGTFSVSVIDLFGGKIPRLVSMETVKFNTPIPLVPTVLLDSNVMALLNQFVLHPERLSFEKTKTVTYLLDYFIHTKVDYNPTFYSLEAVTKNKDDNLKQYYIDFSKSILTLHMMDEMTFLRTRKVVLDQKLFEAYSDKFGVSDIDGMALQDYKWSMEKLSSYNGDLRSFYAVLLKMALIHKTSNKNVHSKLKALSEFVLVNFGVFLAMEIGVASYYFAGKLDKLIPLQRGAHFDSTISKLKAATWDIYLLRLPSLFLAQSEHPIPFVKICTGDKQLAYIGRKFFIWKFFSNKERYYPALWIDHSGLQDVLSDSEMLKLMDTFEEIKASRQVGSGEDRKLGDEELDSLIQKLEDEIREYCN